MFAVSSRATERGILARNAMKAEEDRARRLKAQRDGWMARKFEEEDAERRRKQAKEVADAYAAELRAAGAVYRPTLRSIEAKACRLFKITPALLRSERRDRKVVFARFFVMYWAYRLTTFSLPQIGRLLGGRDHTTVMYAYRSYPKKRAKMGRHLPSILGRETGQ